MSTSRFCLILALSACFAAPALAQAKLKPAVTPVELIRPKKDFKVELIYTVPRETQGSWVSLCVDPKGRLISSDQYGRLYRITPPAIDGNKDAARVEQLPVDLGEAQGLLWAFDCLYVVVNRGRKYPSGLWRVTSSKKNDVLDTKELLRALSDGGEHGPHAVILGPDGNSLYVLHGNHTNLTQLVGSFVPKIWGEDFLGPRLWDASGHAVGRMAPAGCIYKTDKDGKNWTLVSMGYRNEYDAAFNRHGELFTFDADMEWDMNTPWYRPTRVCHAVPGSEFGWRGGTGKMYEYYPDNLPPVVNVGPGSPTGICFGYGAKFPAKYQNALYLCDWSFGKLYACHLTPKGATYTGELEDFLVGSPLPLTDIVVNPTDGAMYFTVGGRKTLSGLYRVSYTGTQSTEPAREARGGTTAVILESVDPAKKIGIIEAVRDATGLGLKDALDLVQRAPVAIGVTKEKAKAVEIKNQLEEAGAKASIRVDNTREQRAIRHKLESFYGKKDAEAVKIAWPYLHSDDRFLRYAARTVLEFQDPASWKDKALAETNAVALTHALIGLARADGDKSLPANTPFSLLAANMLNALARVDWSKLTNAQKIDYLRAYQLTFIRMREPRPQWKDVVGHRIDSWYPAGDRDVNVELCKLICYLEPPDGVQKTLALLAKAPSQEEQMEYALALRTVKTGWTLKQREEYFNWFQKATVFQGGHSFHGFLKNIRKDAIASLSAAEKQQLQKVLAVEPVPSQPKFAFKKRDFVKKWTVDDLLPAVEKGLTGRDFERGRNMFGEAKCFACHRFANEGGGFGPDLTIVSGRFGPRDLLESIIEPSKVISDQYQSIVITTTDGKTIHGRIINLFEDSIIVNTDMLQPDNLTNINRKQVESMAPSKISMMPENLLDTYTQDEILDLVAYLFSRGDRNSKMFRKNKE